MKKFYVKTLVAGCLAVAASAGFSSGARAETITADLVTQTPFFVGSVLSLGGSQITNESEGQLNWIGSSSNPSPFNSTFSTYCLDLVDNIGIPGTYSFDVDTDLSTAPRPTAGGPMGTSAALQMESLYGNEFSSLSTDGDRVAFQLAIWSVVYNGFGNTTVNNSGDNFFVVSGISNSILNEANSFLATSFNGATTDTGPFDFNVSALLGDTVPGTQSFAQDQIFIGDITNLGFPPPMSGVPEINSSGLVSIGILLMGTLAVVESRRVRRGA